MKKTLYSHLLFHCNATNNNNWVILEFNFNVQLYYNLYKTNTAAKTQSANFMGQKTNVGFFVFYLLQIFYQKLFQKTDLGCSESTTLNSIKD